MKTPKFVRCFSDLKCMKLKSSFGCIGGKRSWESFTEQGNVHEKFMFTHIKQLIRSHNGVSTSSVDDACKDSSFTNKLLLGDFHYVTHMFTRNMSLYGLYRKTSKWIFTVTTPRASVLLKHHGAL